MSLYSPGRGKTSGLQREQQDKRVMEGSTRSAHSNFERFDREAAEIQIVLECRAIDLPIATETCFRNSAKESILHARSNEN